jgi:DNA repair exonuclease SbcCD ATPase subunit
MIFGKREKELSIEEKLKEIEERVRGLGKSPQQNYQPTEITQQSIQKTQSVEEREEKTEKVEEESQVPLFVKLDKYKTIVSSLMQLKTLLISLKNSLMVLEQIEKTRIETFNAIIKNLDKMNEKISTLEKEVVKPIGFSIGAPIPTYGSYEEIQSVQASIANLKAQIEQLKTQLDSL